MITAQVEITESLDDKQKKLLKDLCEKIYMIESSIEQISNQQVINDIKGEITLKADQY